MKCHLNSNMPLHLGKDARLRVHSPESFISTVQVADMYTIHSQTASQSAITVQSNFTDQWGFSGFTSNTFGEQRPMWILLGRTEYIILDE